MKLLALELSTARASLAWFNNADMKKAVTEVCDWPNDRKDSARFFATLQKTVSEFGSPDKILVGLGPGSYAGIRIAISAAIGLQATAGAELIGYPSVCTMEGQTDNYRVIGDARRRSFFAVNINKRSVSGNYELLTETELQQYLNELESDIPVLSSDLLPQFQPRVEQKYPSADILGQLVADRRRQFSQTPLEPIYLRDANVTVPNPILGGAIR